MAEQEQEQDEGVVHEVEAAEPAKSVEPEPEPEQANLDGLDALHALALDPDRPPQVAAEFLPAEDHGQQDLEDDVPVDDEAEPADAGDADD